MRDIDSAPISSGNTMPLNPLLMAQTGQMSLLKTVVLEMDKSTPPAPEVKADPIPDQAA